MPAVKPSKVKTALRKRRTKYINAQRHKASCGPIAVANAIKWLGIETSYTAVLNWCKGVQAYHTRKGMWPFQMRYVLRTLQMPFKVRRKVLPEDMDVILNKGGALILIYDTKKQGAHAVFIDKASETQYRVWNKIKGEGPWYDKAIVWADMERSGCRKGHLYVYIFQRVTPAKKSVQRQKAKV